MKINLLKNRKVLSEKDYLREKKFLQIAITSLVIVFVLTLAMALWNWMLSNKLANIESSISKANSQLSGLAEANAEQVYVKNRLTLIGNFLDEQAVSRESLQQVLALSLPGVTIGGINFMDKNQVEVVIDADSVESLGSVVSYYEQQDGYFPQVISQGMTKLKDGGYEMKLTLTLPHNKQG